jgi:hypothetical protein
MCAWRGGGPASFPTGSLDAPTGPVALRPRKLHIVTVVTQDRAELDALVEAALQARTESATVDFKRQFDPAVPAEFVELTKDVVAMANSGGGCLIIGLNDDGSPSGADLSRLLSLDPATLTDKVAKYTRVQFARFEILPIVRGSDPVAAVVILGASPPMVFEKAGSYQHPSGAEKVAFAQGTMYFRHGAKSEPGTNDDVSGAVDAQINRIRQSWLGNIKQVVEAPLGHVVHMLPPDVTLKDDPSAAAIRITDSETAPAYRISTPDKDCPHRQKDLVAAVKARLGPTVHFNQYDIQALARVHSINSSKPQFFYQSRFGPKQYSERLVDWIEVQYLADPEFFARSRTDYRLSLRRANH